MSENSPNVPMALTILEESGHEPFLLTSGTLFRYMLPASVDAYGDGELAIAHQPLSGELARLFGAEYFKDGSVMNKLRTAALANKRKPGPIYDYQGTVARYFDRALSTRQFAMPDTLRSSVQISGDLLQFDSMVAKTDGPLQRVIDYGAGIAGQSHIAEQVQAVRERREPYSYTPITRLPFTNRFLVSRYNSLLGPGSAEAAIRHGIYNGHETGIAAATNELLKVQTTDYGTAEVADVIIASGIHAAPLNEIKTGLTNAYQLLRAGGTLVIRSVAEAALGETDADTMIDIAHLAGFDRRHTQSYRTMTGALGARLANGGLRHSVSAVLTK